jgi:DNA-directed RNA polymerase sigma subunit (sigma70/sigma32)
VRDLEIDARLALLLEVTPRGVELSCGEIARAVGCTRQRIWYIEQQALRKLRERAGHPALRMARSLL